MGKRYLMNRIYESGKYFKDTVEYFLNHPGGKNREESFKEVRARNKNMLLVDLND